MTAPRLTAAMRVSALIRLAESDGGIGTVLAKGDPTAGPVVIVGLEKGRFGGFFERLLDASGNYAWQPAGGQPAESDEQIQAYLDRRRRNDPDLWLIELNVSELSRFIAQAASLA